MKSNDRVFLSDRQLAIVCSILLPVRSRMGPIKVFGSRATGRARPASNLNLVVFPPSSHRELSQLRLAFEESYLPIYVILSAWDEIDSQRLRDEIERDAIVFFEEAEA